MVYLNPSNWTGSFRPPGIADVRWRAFGLLALYLILGVTFLGFSRQPFHIILLIGSGAVLDLVLSGLLNGRKIFPLSAMISCSSLAILLNWSFGLNNLWLPVFICVACKYLITLKGRHFFNPSLLAICICILLGNEIITLSPAYQWYGSAETASMMLFFVITGALMLFVFKINRGWLIGAFLLTYLAQTLLRASIMEHIIPWETLLLSSVTSPAFFLFTFYMITDPATSPNTRRDQILVGVSIALLDLAFHLKFSLFTFFFAGLTVALLRYVYFLFKAWFVSGELKPIPALISKTTQLPVLILFMLPALYAFQQNQNNPVLAPDDLFTVTSIPSEHSGLKYERSDLLEQTDPRLAHVAKWILSVGDAAAVADVNLDGLPDLFLTQILKHPDYRAKLYLNIGDFQFEKTAIPELDRYLHDPVKYGLPAFAFFLDYDNDGDEDLFVGFGFGPSRLFENRIIPDGALSFQEVTDAALLDHHSICLSANAFDFDRDGKLDLMVGNTLQTHLPGYPDPAPALNIFKLPKPEFEGDRRMFRFMHESWHNANNGGLNHLYRNLGSGQFVKLDNEKIQLPETRWSLAIGTADFNQDGFTDLYIANDFGRDDCYLNIKGQYFERQQGTFYGDLGLDTYKGMNVSIGDVTGNGREDIYVSNVHHAMQAEGSLLWLNETPPGATKLTFKERAASMHALNTNRFGWGAAMGDLNLNGWLDIVQANGMVSDAWDPKWDQAKNYWYFQAQIARTSPEIHSYVDMWADIRGCYIYPDEPDRIMLNNYGNGFVDRASTIGFDHLQNTRGVILADFDNDGDLDFLITNQFGAPILYQNNLHEKSWLGLQLAGNGNTTNRNAVGSKVWIRYKQKGQSVEQYREVRLVNGFSAMGDTRLLFGFGDLAAPPKDLEITIQWHDGTIEIIRPTQLQQYIIIKQATPLL
jgi:enediyne biosynthesis protein E4